MNTSTAPNAYGTATPNHWHYTACMQAEAAQVPGQPSNITCFRAKLQEPLKPGSSIDLEWYSVHVGLMTPFPAKASQSDPQRVLMKGSHYAPSPYPISTQTTKASLKLLRMHAAYHLVLSSTMRSMQNSLTPCTGHAAPSSACIVLVLSACQVHHDSIIRHAESKYCHAALGKHHS